MDDAVRETLSRILEEYGAAICTDPRRLRGLLLDLCGQHKREVHVLVASLDEQIPSKLQSNAGGMPGAILVNRLADELARDRGLAPDAAAWAVNTWAYALKLSVPVVTPSRGMGALSAPRAAAPSPLAPTSGAALAEHGPSREITRNDGAPMVLVPAGVFTMGSESGGGDEKPAHRVELDAFHMDKYLVTNRLYRKFLQATGHTEPPVNDANFAGDDQPVVDVSWDDAAAYCRWAGKRLPTEAEWEKAARGGLEGKLYPWGDEKPRRRACFNPGWFGPDRTTPVGAYQANGYGLFDLAGNVWEWCADWYDGAYYASSPRQNPRGPPSGTFRVLRGGSWYNSADKLRCAYRNFYGPTRFDDRVGFRCARSLR